MPFFFQDENKRQKKDLEEGRIPHKDFDIDVGYDVAGGDLLLDELLKANPSQAIQNGRFMMGKTDMDQHITINPDCLPGQAEIIYMAFMYRLYKWHFIFKKSDESLQISPVQAPPFFTLSQVKEKLESHIKQQLSFITSETAEYELFKSDVRKYGEILDYFQQAKNGDEHILRSLFIDRVDANTGEGFSMITMARRWPTIITDFMRIKESWDSIEDIQKGLSISRAEATVLRTKNKIFKHWKEYFFRDIKDRYIRVKSEMQSQEKQIEEYSNWIKPYINKFKRIREVSSFKSSSDLTNAQIFAFYPFSILNARLFCWRGFEPEETAKAFREQTKVDPVDDFVIEWTEKIEKHYGVSFVRRYNQSNGTELTEDDYESRRKAVKSLVDGWSDPSGRSHEMINYVMLLDKRYMYYTFYDITYEVDYIKGSQGPLEMEDVYYHIFPSNISQNILVVLLLELEAREMRFDRYVERLIGTSNIEDELRRDVNEALKDDAKDEEKSEKPKKPVKIRIRAWKRKTAPRLYFILKYLRKQGPYETNIKERISKEYAIYLGNWTTQIYDHIKKICYSMSGVEP